MDIQPELTPKIAKGYIDLACAGIAREYPNAPQLLLGSATDLETNRSLHLAFFGCFDWHSAVHSHWLLVRLLRSGLLDDEASKNALAVLNRYLTAENLATELDYFSKPGRAGFEFPYGWAWLLRLWHEAGSFSTGLK